MLCNVMFTLALIKDRKNPAQHVTALGIYHKESLVPLSYE